jgi:hypothetical protein
MGRPSRNYKTETLFQAMQGFVLISSMSRPLVAMSRLFDSLLTSSKSISLGLTGHVNMISRSSGLRSGFQRFLFGYLLLRSNLSVLIS